MAKTYKPAKGPVGKATYASFGQKPAKKARISLVDKKVKRVASKVMNLKTEKAPPKASFDRY